MSARMVSSSLNAMHESKRQKAKSKPIAEPEPGQVTVRPTRVSIVYKKVDGNATVIKASVVGIRVP
jgi:hypothetical protein